MPLFFIVSMGDTMKKLIIIFLALLIPLSCGKREELPTENERGLSFPMTVTAHLQSEAGNAKVIIDYESAEYYTIRYTEPEIMQGITYGVDSEGAYMSFGESRIPVTTGDYCFGSLAVGRLLCPKEGDSVNIESENGVPVRATGEIDGFSATLSEINIQGQ